MLSQVHRNGECGRGNGAPTRAGCDRAELAKRIRQRRAPAGAARVRGAFRGGVCRHQDGGVVAECLAVAQADGVPLPGDMRAAVAASASNRDLL